MRWAGFRAWAVGLALCPGCRGLDVGAAAGDTTAEGSAAVGAATAAPLAPGAASSPAAPPSARIGGEALPVDAFWPPTGQSCRVALGAGQEVLEVAPQAYLDACAGCHGPTGAGQGPYPAIVGARSLDALTQIVRQGRTSGALEMPAFRTAWLDDDDLARIQAYLTGQPISELKVCTPRPPMSPAQLAQAAQLGLAAWRQRDGRTDPNGITSNVACVQCHAPDPLDLAYYGFTDGDILRRALQHLAVDQAGDILEWVHALRQIYRIGRRSPQVARPFQPGGSVLVGDSIAARDAAFAAELVQLGLAVATQPIGSPTAAVAAMDELWAVNRHTLKIPIPFDHYAEDPFDTSPTNVPDCDGNLDACLDHGSIADWIPSAPHVPSAWPPFLAAMDAYLADPNDQTFAALKGSLPAAETMPGTYAYGTIELDHNKYRSLMFANFCLQLEVRGLPGCYDRGQTPFPNQADIWDVGTTANLFGTGYSLYPDCDTGWQSCPSPPANLPAWPAHLLADISPRATLSSNFSRLRHPWMTLWWIHFDPALLATGDPTAQKDEYFTRSLFWANNNDWQFDGSRADQVRPTYSVFAAFEVMLHNVAVLKSPQLASCKVYPATDFPCTEVDVRSGFFPNVINFAEGNQPLTPEQSNNVHYQSRFMPKDAARRPTFQLLTANLYRMFFWQLIGQLDQDAWICRPDLQRLRIARAKAFLQEAETQEAQKGQDDEMFARLDAGLDKARVACPPQSAVGGPNGA